MKIYDAIAEMQMLKTICDTSDPATRVGIWSRLDEDSFGDDTTKSIYSRLKMYLDSGKEIPSTRVLAVDHSLGDDARALLANPAAAALERRADIARSMEILDENRRGRIVFKTVADSLEELRGGRPDIDGILGRMNDMIHQCSTEADEDEMEHYGKANAEEICREVARDLQDRAVDEFIPTGYVEFDRRTGGLKRKNVLVVASVPGGGKSTMALQMARSQYSMGFNVCYVSIEMDKIELRYRLLSSTSQIDHGDINLKRLSKAKIKHVRDEFYKFLNDTAGDGTNTLTVFCPREEKSINDIVRDIEHLNFDCVVVDYIGLLKDSSSKKALWETLGEHAKQAKMAANKMNAAFIMLAQYDDEGNKIKYSRAIEAHANFIWVWDHGDREKESGIINVRQLKARSAKEYDFYLKKDFSVCCFRDHLGPPPEYEGDEDDEKDAKGKKGKKKTGKKAKAATKGEDGDAVKKEAKSIPRMPQLV